MKECKHNSSHIVHSPDDGGYYKECLDCWGQSEITPTEIDAQTITIN